MIIRLWRGRSPADVADRYQEFVTTVVFPRLERIDGFLDARVFRRPLDERFEFLVVTEWAGWDSIRAFAGDPPDRAVVEPDARQWLSDFDERVDHFELAGEGRNGV